MNIQEKIYKYFETNSRLKVLFIFEDTSLISDSLGELVWTKDYIFREFGGDWFNTKYLLENDWKDKRVVLLFPNEMGGPGQDFPLMDLLKANMEYCEDDYASFMQQYRLPEKYRPFIRRRIAELQATKVMTILESYLSPEFFSEDVAIRSLISAYLGEKKLLDWDSVIISILLLGRTSEKKKRDNFFQRVEKNGDVKGSINKRLIDIFNVSYSPNSERKMEGIAQRLKYNSITQLLAPACSDFYKSLKINSSSQLQQINHLFNLGSTSKQWSKGFYEAIAEMASDIRESELIKVYGVDAQFFVLTEELAWPLINHLLAVNLVGEPEATRKKVRELAQKFTGNDLTLSALNFIDRVAMFTEKYRKLGSIKLSTPQDYINRYVEDYFQFDQLYRKALEEYHKLNSADVPAMEMLEKRKHQLDIDYARLANDINIEWIQCVAERGEYFDSLNIPRQDSFYEREYLKTHGKNKMVVVISDALRYEVAKELMEVLCKERNIANLSAQLAMLPTETKYCKQALLPYQELRLTRENGNVEMLVDGKVLSTIAARSAHLGAYRDKAICMSYADYVKNTRDINREIFKRPLVYLYHDTIDAAGHGLNSVNLIDAIRRSIEQLSALVKSLHSSMNVVNVIVTSDHGFLFNDIGFEEKDKNQVQDSDIEKKTRYYLTTNRTEVQGVMKFPVEKVSSIRSDISLHVGVPKGTNRIAAAGGYSFAHGGASLQEMIVPVIHSQRKRVDKTDFVGVTLLTHELNVVSSRLKFDILQDTVVDMFTQQRGIVCALYQGEKKVSAEIAFTLDSTEPETSNRIHPVSLTLNQSVAPGLLQLRIYDTKDDKKLNPLITETVKNNTIIEQDF